MNSILSITGLILVLLGLVVTIAFWIPKVFNRKKLREMLGDRYPIVYFIYIANGPMLMALGVFLLSRSS